MPTQAQLNAQKKRTSFAWSQYYAACRAEHRVNVSRVNTLQEVVPAMLENELKEMYTELKRSIDCPICLDVIQPDSIDFSSCGHKYCKQCLDRLKAEDSPKCAMCRKTIYVKS